MKGTATDAALAGERPDPLLVGVPPELLTMAEVAERLRSARSTVYELLAVGELSSLTIGRRRYITATELARFIAARQEAGR